jgi:hypothetical protein
MWMADGALNGRPGGGGLSIQNHDGVDCRNGDERGEREERGERNDRIIHAPLPSGRAEVSH